MGKINVKYFAGLKTKIMEVKGRTIRINFEVDSYLEDSVAYSLANVGIKPSKKKI